MNYKLNRYKNLKVYKATKYLQISVTSKIREMCLFSFSGRIILFLGRIKKVHTELKLCRSNEEARIFCHRLYL